MPIPRGMERHEKWIVAIVVGVLVVIVGTVAVWQAVAEHQRQERIERIGREMGEDLARDMLD